MGSVWFEAAGQRPQESRRRNGRRYFELTKAADLSSTFTRVAQELHSQYVIGFTPMLLDGKIHKLSVRMKQPA